MKEVVRVCEPTYKVEELKSEGINVIDLVFDDGTFPPNEVKISSLVFISEATKWKYIFFLFIFILFIYNNF